MQAAAASDSITARCHAAAGGRRGPHGDAARLKGCQVPPRRGHAVGMGPLRGPPAASSAPTAPRGNGGSVGLLPPAPALHPTVLPHALLMSPPCCPTPYGSPHALTPVFTSCSARSIPPLCPRWMPHCGPCGAAPCSVWGWMLCPRGCRVPEQESLGCVGKSRGVSGAPMPWAQPRCGARSAGGLGAPHHLPVLAGCHRPHCAIGVWLMDFGVWSMNSGVWSVGFGF